jgi:hypothetical protein
MAVEQLLVSRQRLKIVDRAASINTTRSPFLAILEHDGILETAAELDAMVAPSARGLVDILISSDPDKIDTSDPDFAASFARASISKNRSNVRSNARPGAVRRLRLRE